MKSATVMLAAFSLVGCAPQIIMISPSDRIIIKNQLKLQAVYYSPPPFSTYHLERGRMGSMFGLVGAIIDAASAKTSKSPVGETIVIEDPALKISTDVSSRIAKGLGAKEVDGNREPLNSDDIMTLRKVFEKGVVFDFKTTEWGLVEYQEKYYFKYEVMGRAINLDSSRVLWRGLCRYGPQDSQFPHRLTDFTANDGSYLKERLNDMADVCTKELTEQFFQNRSAE
ncbi:MAG: hypothetical protein HY349_04785 [Nitrospirae bacterium]|nr:hypothetical protein [Nitrospirota bacterium]